MIYRGNSTRFFFLVFISFIICLGYIDDLRNTDNAWVEAEVWNFHYGATVSFPELRADVYSFFIVFEQKNDFDKFSFYLGYGIVERSYTTFQRFSYSKFNFTRNCSKS